MTAALDLLTNGGEKLLQDLTVQTVEAAESLGSEISGICWHQVAPWPLTMKWLPPSSFGHELSSVCRHCPLQDEENRPPWQFKGIPIKQAWNRNYK